MTGPRISAVTAIAHARIFYICTQCFNDAPDGCGRIDRGDLRIVPDGRWLCVDCYDGEWVSGQPQWESLELPPEYGPKEIVAALSPTAEPKPLTTILNDWNGPR